MYERTIHYGHNYNIDYNPYYPRGYKIERIYRILLSKRGKRKRRTWYQIAKEGNVSYGWAHKILSDLQDKKIIQGSIVKKPRRLFEIWSNHQLDIPYKEYHIQRPKNVIKEVKLYYAFTTYIAENIIGNYLFPRLYDIYIYEEHLLDWHSILSKKGYVGKGNVRILLSDKHVFRDRKIVDGWPIVSIQQIIVDLMREGGECGDAADLLIKRFYND